MAITIDGTTATGSDTDGGGVTVTVPAVTNRVHIVTEIAASGDAAALVTVESPASTVLWRQRFSGAFTLNKTFAPGVMKGADGQAVLVKVSAATTNSEANISTYTIDY